MTRPDLSAQFTFEFEPHVAHDFESFEDAGNVQVLERLKEMADGRTGAITLNGTLGSGKTHLLLATCARAERRAVPVVYAPMAELADTTPSVLDGLSGRTLVCLDDVDSVATSPPWRQALFRLWNTCDAAGASLLLATTTPVFSLESGLADLDSRWRSALALKLAPLDDAARGRALHQIAARRGFELPADAVNYLLNRLPRDMHSLTNAVIALDRLSMASHRRVSVPLVRSWLATETVDATASR